jgi:hypothetical protein
MSKQKRKEGNALIEFNHAGLKLFIARLHEVPVSLACVPGVAGVEAKDGQTLLRDFYLVVQGHEKGIFVMPKGKRQIHHPHPWSVHARGGGGEGGVGKVRVQGIELGVHGTVWDGATHHPRVTTKGCRGKGERGL